MRVFATKPFQKFARDNNIDSESLCKAATEISSGLVHANLGGGVYKQRVARKGRGKSGGFRTIICFRVQTAAFFVYGFAKNEMDNIAPENLHQFRKLAEYLLGLSAADLKRAIEEGKLFEVKCD